MKEDKESWRKFLRRLKERGLSGMAMFISDKSLGLVGAFPDGQSALMLVAARLRHIAGTKWGARRSLDPDHLKEQ
jgi:transposase-like protein